MLTVSLRGGLGNQLFQIAAGHSIAEELGYKFYLPDEPSPKTPHSQKDYYQSILQNWKKYRVKQTDTPTIVVEPNYYLQPWKEMVDGNPHVCLDGFFQNYNYVSQEFVDSLVLPETPCLDGVFLHIRGGDFVNNPQHDIGLDEYYEKAIKMFPPGTMFYVFTNDLNYAKTKEFLKNIRHEFVDETDELMSLSLMRNCKKGGICANSSFSWWGAFLNPTRKLTISSRWYKNPYIFLNGYFFPGSIVI